LSRHCCCRCSDLPEDILSDLQRDVMAIRIALMDQSTSIIEIKRELTTMTEREDAAWARQAELIQSVKDGYSALVTERDAWKKAAEDAGAALESDSLADAEKVEAANAALEELVAQPAPTPEPTPEPPA
jgi:hypothetical protein